jgi:hypothetical protein
MMPALLRLLLVFATLPAQTPCGLVYHSLCAGEPAAAGCCDCHSDDGDRDCDRDRDADHDPAPRPECPAGCPCMFCSPGFVPLTDFGCLTQPADTSVGPPLSLAAHSRGHAGHPSLLDRPPRLV